MCRGVLGGGDARVVDEVAAEWFPPVAGAVVWHLHVDPASGEVLVGDGSLAPEEFYDQVVAARQGPERLLVLVGCGAGPTGPGAGESVAEVLARRSGRPVLAADTYAWATPDGRILVDSAPGRAR